MDKILIDRDRVRTLFKNFYTLTHIRIAFIDVNRKEYIQEPENLSDFCSILRQDANAYQKCIECDRIGFETAQRINGLYVYECHAGLTEAVSPINMGGKLLGYLMMGQALKCPPSKQYWQNICKKKCLAYRLDFHALEKTFYRLNYLTWEKIHAAACIMDIAAKYIYLSKLITFKEAPLAERIRKYVEANLGGPVTISVMSRDFNMSMSYLSRRVKSEFNQSLTEYARGMKLRKASELLEQTDMKIGEIAMAVGFPDQNYFTRVFKRATGFSPTVYRTRRRKGQDCAN